MADTFNRFVGARSVYGMKKPVRAATTANITIAGYGTIDGVTFASTDEAANYNMRILVKDQTDTTQNGIYIVQSGDWARDKDFDGNTDYTNSTSVFVSQGTVNGGRVFTVSSADPQNIGIAATSFSRFGLDRITRHGADVLSATPLDLDSATGEIVDVTSTNTISSITLSDGRIRVVRFTAALMLGHSASLVLPGAQSIVTAAGDYAIFVGYASSVVRCVGYMRYDGHPLITLLPTTSLVSAATTNLGSNIAQCLNVSGSVTITSFGSTAPTGAVKFVEFSGAPLITNSANIILEGAQNIQAAAGDCIIIRHEGSGVWRELAYRRANSHPLTTGSTSLLSAATTDLGSVREQYITITGANTITSFGTSAPIGAIKFLTFQSSLQLTYNGTSMLLPGGGNITTSAGDTGTVVHEGSGNWRMTCYHHARPSGIIYVDYAQHAMSASTGTTVAQNLTTYTLPANSVTLNGNGLRIFAWGLTAATTVTKNITISFEGTDLAATGAIALNNGKWRFDSYLVRQSSAAQETHTTVLADSASILPAVCQISTSSVDLTAASTLTISAVCTSTAASEVVLHGLTVELRTQSNG